MENIELFFSPSKTSLYAHLTIYMSSFTSSMFIELIVPHLLPAQNISTAAERLTGTDTYIPEIDRLRPQADARE